MAKDSNFKGPAGQRNSESSKTKVTPSVDDEIRPILIFITILLFGVLVCDLLEIYDFLKLIQTYP